MRVWRGSSGPKSGTSYDSVRLSGDRIECTTKYARGALTIVASLYLFDSMEAKEVSWRRRQQPASSTATTAARLQRASMVGRKSTAYIGDNTKFNCSYYTRPDTSLLISADSGTC
jgi:hypothetical protein